MNNVIDRQAREVFAKESKNMLVYKLDNPNRESVFYTIGCREGIANELKLEPLINRDTDSYFEYVTGYIDGLLLSI
jgi:hypothetical protein